MSIRPTNFRTITGTTATVALGVVLVVIGVPFIGRLVTLGQDGPPPTPATGGQAVLNVAFGVLVLVSFLVLVLRMPTWPRWLYFCLLLAIATWVVINPQADTAASTPEHYSLGVEVVSQVLAVAFFIVPALYMRLVTPKKYRGQAAA